MSKSVMVDHEEITRFDRLADSWWDPAGPMGTLHDINPLRLEFIMGTLGVKDKRVLDVGCGGGILAEAFAGRGARVMGIDMSGALLDIARRHAHQSGIDIDYRFADVEEIAEKYSAEFDLVTCMEVLEHVPDPERVMAACSRLLKPGGHAFFSTIDRTFKSFLFAIIGGEYILGLLPRGTHAYDKLLRPGELKKWAIENNLKFLGLSSLIYNPLNGKFGVEPREDINYMIHFIRE